jgi:hypothetical protein
LWSIFFYAAIAICGFVIYLQAAYFADYFADPQNVYRDEYLIGIFLVGFLSYVVWAPLIVASLHSRSRLTQPQRRLGILLGGLDERGQEPPFTNTLTNDTDNRLDGGN